jgi:hypothetical protein
LVSWQVGSFFKAFFFDDGKALFGDGEALFVKGESLFSDGTPFNISFPNLEVRFTHRLVLGFKTFVSGQIEIFGVFCFLFAGESNLFYKEHILFLHIHAIYVVVHLEIP